MIRERASGRIKTGFSRAAIVEEGGVPWIRNASAHKTAAISHPISATYLSKTTTTKAY